MNHEYLEALMFMGMLITLGLVMKLTDSDWNGWWFFGMWLGCMLFCAAFGDWGPWIGWGVCGVVSLAIGLTLRGMFLVVRWAWRKRV